MDLDEAVRQRRSIRAFKDKPVSRELIEEILTLAVRAPSWGNTQPWEIVVVGGPTVRELTDEFVALGDRGVKANPDFAMPWEWSGSYMDRYRGVGKELFRILGIPRDDQEARTRHWSNNMRGFGAPNLIYLTLDQSLTTVYSVFDSGSLAAHICLLAVSRGLGTCLLAALTIYPDAIRKHLNLPQEKKIVLGLALGWPDEEAEVNRMRTTRAPLEELVKWVGME